MCHGIIIIIWLVEVLQVVAYFGSMVASWEKYGSSYYIFSWWGGFLGVIRVKLLHIWWVGALLYGI